MERVPFGWTYEQAKCRLAIQMALLTSRIRQGNDSANVFAGATVRLGIQNLPHDSHAWATFPA